MHWHFYRLFKIGIWLTLTFGNPAAALTDGELSSEDLQERKQISVEQNIKKRSIEALEMDEITDNEPWLIDNYNPHYDNSISRFNYGDPYVWRKRKETSYPFVEYTTIGLPERKSSHQLYGFTDGSVAGYVLPYIRVRGRRKAFYPPYFIEDGTEYPENVASEDMPLESALRQFKRSAIPSDSIYYFGSKRTPSEIGSRGFHEGIFTHGFGDFSPVKRGKRSADVVGEDSSERLDSQTWGNPIPYSRLLKLHKRRPEWDSSGFHGDTFTNGFGAFYTMRKRRPEMDSYGFHGDTFHNGFGDFYTMKRKPEMTSSGFHGDTFSGGFGDFYTMKRGRDSSNENINIRNKRAANQESNKRVPEMTSSGFHGDTFSGGFGDFYTMKRNEQKRRPEMSASGFHGDTFTGGFGDFYTMKRDQNKRRPEMTSSGFHGDTFSGGFGDFYTMKRRPEMTSSGFHGDTFSGGFGDFYTMKRMNNKRRPEMTSSGFHGDTFTGGFGDFYTMKRNVLPHDKVSQNSEEQSQNEKSENESSNNSNYEKKLKESEGR